MIKKHTLKFILLLSLVFQSVLVFGQSGAIKGQIMDKESQSPLPFADIILEGTTLGAMTDIDGQFIITGVPAGKYRVSGSSLSYETQTLENVTVNAGETSQIRMALSLQDNILETVGIVVQANRETEAVLLLDRKKAILSQQSIGAVELSRKGIGDAQAAVSSVSGIAKQEGVKNIFVRGLGDRYNTTLLNGLPVPSEDPEYKNIDLSIFETDIIQNISVDKVFSAQNTGDAGGAIIDISSKELIGRSSLGLDLSSGFNSNTIGKTFYKPDGANYFGFARAGRPTAGQFDFANSLDPSSPAILWDQNYRLSGGKRFYLGDNPLSFFVVAGHSTENLFTEETVRNTISNGTIYQDQIGKKYGNNTHQLILAHINYDLNRAHSVAYNFMMLHSTDQYVGDYLGRNSERFQDAFDDRGFIRRQQINDNLLFVHQLLSRWKLNENLTLTADFSINTIKGLEPDRRENYLSQKENGSFGLTGSNRQKRFFSELKEQDYTTKFELSYGLQDALESGNSNISFGYQARLSNNDFESVEYNLSPIPGSVSLEDIKLDELYNPTNFKNDVFSVTESNPNRYEVAKNNHSVFAQGNYQVTKAWSVNMGFRTDFVDLQVKYDVPGQTGQNSIKSPYYLPSFNLKYELNEKNSFRLGASKTYTLPQSKEISPFQYVNISFASEGNPNLIPSDNYNFDLKWDNYWSASELFSATLFYKRIKNPIGRVDKGNSAGLLTYENISDAADVMGIEVELQKNIFNRKSLETKTEDKLTLGTNASYILTSTDLKLTNTPTRNSGLEGASPFLLNVDATFHHSRADKSLATSLVFNYFSDRIYTIGTIGYKDIMEEGVASLNWVANYQFSKKWGLRLKVENLLDSPVELTRKISRSNEKITLNKFNKGINFSFGLSLKI